MSHNILEMLRYNKIIEQQQQQQRKKLLYRINIRHAIRLKINLILDSLFYDKLHNKFISKFRDFVRSKLKYYAEILNLQ